MLGAARLVDQWRELLGGYAVLVWIAIVVLATAWVFVPFWVYVDAQRRASRPVFWTWLTAVAPVVLLPGALILPRYIPLWALGALVLPVGIFVAYLILRASARTCPECGRVMQANWKFCPNHPQRLRSPEPMPVGMAASGAGYPAVMPAPGQIHALPESRAGTPSGAADTFAMLLVQEGRGTGRTFYVASSGSVVGRDQGSDVAIDDPSVSSRHARIGKFDGRAQIIDLGSTNGTYVNDSFVDRSFLYDGDRVRIGDTVLVFKELR
jgi:FHA domain